MTWSGFVSLLWRCFVPGKQTWLSKPKKPGYTCAEWTTNLITQSSVNGWSWRCWTSTNQVRSAPILERFILHGASGVLLWRFILFLSSFSVVFKSANVIRSAGRLAGWTTHCCQPRTTNSPAWCWHHSPMCCLWYSYSKLPVVQERTGTPRKDMWHTTGK